MISWTNLSSDIRYVEFGDFVAKLSLLDSLAIISRLNTDPLIIFHCSCQQRIMEHISTSHYELGGLLFGDVVINPLTHLPNIVNITDIVVSEEYDHSSVSLRMDTAVWDIARDRINDGFTVVGWYHSHPNLGAYFSSTDRKTQKNVFNHIYSAGYVVDPYQNEAKWYIGSQSIELDPDKILMRLSKL